MQSQEAFDAYNALFAEGLFPNSEMLFFIAVLVVAAIALWQARTFVSKF
ncbi:hypothetical protein [Methanomassiliicoccus luminyensis]|jgi:hypothetical protein|nr:hypothetical protein [Methanomassiliicoccus luminyensis]